MTIAGRAQQDATDGRRAFRHYLRSGQVLALAENIETKFNPNHDPQNGRFTFGRGGTAAQLRAATSDSLGPVHVVKLKPDP